MAPTVQNVVFDCADAYALATWWSKVFEVPMSDEDAPGDPEVAILLPTGLTLYFQAVPEPKTVKNRVHVCLQAETRRDDDVARMLDLGATMLADHRRADGTGFVVLTDPEGNEFCVLRSAAERAAR
ncbi:VOC family protein [Asanoa sp. NPDC050611]|uniref:VOC family protein n=1 Tax=Asanoa sp. NPDC050611 TaxID=3157098 RepID=UPI003410E453